jgi:heme exporter protein C
MSVYLFRTLHPMPIVLKPERPSLPPEMLRTLLFSFAAFVLVYVALLRARYALAIERARLDALEGHYTGGH